MNQSEDGMLVSTLKIARAGACPQLLQRRNERRNYCLAREQALCCNLSQKLSSARRMDVVHLIRLRVCIEGVLRRGQSQPELQHRSTMKTGMSELARLAAQALETKKPVNVPEQVTSALQVEYRVRVQAQMEEIRRHQREAQEQWSQIKLR